MAPNSEPEYETIGGKPNSGVGVGGNTDHLDTAGIRDLGNAELLGLVQEMTECGVSRFVPLPELVVVGDQSAGKSSVLEAITELSFPQGDTRCTRFATQLILRPSDVANITTTIQPYKPEEGSERERERSDNDKQRLIDFKRDIKHPKDLADVIEDAKKVMKFNGDFSLDVLCIEIAGPNKPPLTLIDLPGLIHQGSNADVRMVTKMARDYMGRKRTIILAIVEALHESDLQAVLQHAKDLDPDGHRTFGIITKPDKLDAYGTSAKKKDAVIALAKNLDQKNTFRHGWHVLRNRDNNSEEHLTFKQRDEKERRFFETGRWAELPKEHVGIASLRKRLSNLLLGHIKRTLRDVRKDIDDSLEDTKAKLALCGDQRLETDQQRTLLHDKSEAFKHYCKEAIDGNYDDKTFFKAGFPEFNQYNSRNLRARIQNLNESFAQVMLDKGHEIKLVECISTSAQTPRDENASDSDNESNVEEDIDEQTLSPSTPLVVEPPREFLRDEAIKSWVRDVDGNNRGRELPGGHNINLMPALFREQSKKWEAIVEHHVEKCWNSCLEFIQQLLDEIVPFELQEPLRAHWIDERLSERHTRAIEELQKVLDDLRRCHPIAYNRQYLDAVTNAHFRREQNKKSTIIKEVFGLAKGTLVGADGNPVETILSSVLDSVLNSTFDIPDKKRGMEDIRCEEALDDMLAYYDVAVTRFINDIAVQVIERQLVSKLWNVFASRDVNKMSAETLRNIAEESPDKLAHRQYLQEKLMSLQKGAELCKRYLRHCPNGW